MQCKKYISLAGEFPYKVSKRTFVPSISKTPEIVVSLTTYPARKASALLAIESILHQTRKPDLIVLYLSKEQFSENDDEFIRKNKEKGISVRLVDGDLKPHKKYYYAMKEFPDSNIVTIDDDIIYDKNMINDLYESHLRCPNSVIAKRVHRIVFSGNGQIKRYSDWQQEYREQIDIPRMDLFATGCGGVLYPPGCMPDALWDEQGICSTCLDADDLWLKCFELLGNVPVVLAKSNNYHLHHVWGTVTNGLSQGNVVDGQNDVQLKRICDYLDMDFHDYVSEISTNNVEWNVKR